MWTTSGPDDKPEGTDVADLLALLAPDDPDGRRSTSARPAPPSAVRRAGPPLATPPRDATPGPASPSDEHGGGLSAVRTAARVHPLPGVPVGRTGTDPATIILTAAPGTPVHAIEAGQVRRPESAAAAVVLTCDSGFTFGYHGLALAPGISDGRPVEAGTVLGVLDAAAGSGPEGLHLHVQHRDAGPVDAGALLAGLPDPDELGQAPVDGGLDVDPDALDQAIVESVERPPWEATP